MPQSISPIKRDNKYKVAEEQKKDDDPGQAYRDNNNKAQNDSSNNIAVEREAPLQVVPVRKPHLGERTKSKIVLSSSKDALLPRRDAIKFSNYQDAVAAENNHQLPQQREESKSAM